MKDLVETHKIQKGHINCTGFMILIPETQIAESIYGDQIYGEKGLRTIIQGEEITRFTGLAYNTSFNHKERL